MVYSDKLIEDYIVENYIPKVAQNETDRQAAEEAFTTELFNGPRQKVWYGGNYGWDNFGSFDLDNFHKAYDKFFEDNNLLDLFKDDGLLVNTATYGKMKDLDKNIPAVKALKYLWGAQFKNERKFYSEVAKERAEKENKQQAKQDAVEIVNSINELEEVKEFKNLYNTDYVINKPEITVELTPVDLGKYSKLTIIFNNVIKGPIEYGTTRGNYNYNTSIKIEVELEDNKIDYDKIFEAVKKEIQRLTLIYKAYEFTVTNDMSFKSRPEAWILNRTSIDIYYYSPREHKYYKVKFIEFQNSHYDGILLQDIDNPKEQHAKFTNDLKLVAARTDKHSSSNTSRGWGSESETVFFNSKYDEEVLKKMGIEKQSVDLGYAGGTGQNGITVEKLPSTHPYARYFDSVSDYHYSWDHSD